MSEIVDGWNKKYETEPEITDYDTVQFLNGVFGGITFNGLWG